MLEPDSRLLAISELSDKVSNELTLRRAMPLTDTVVNPRMMF